MWESIGYRARMMMKAGMGDPAYVNDKLTGTLKRKVDQENTETLIQALAEALRNPETIPVVED